MTPSRQTPPDRNNSVDQKTHGAKRTQQTTALRRWSWFLFRCLLYYLGVVLVLAFLQRTLMYPATRVEQLRTQDAGLPMGQVHDVTIQSKDGLTIHGWHILPRGKTAINSQQCDQALIQGGPVVLFFCGNGGNRRHRTDEYQLLTDLNCHVFVFDYRGYGDNPGSPSENKIVEDGLQAWHYVTKSRGVAPGRVVLFGESLGGGVATRLAAEVCQSSEEPGGLILRSTFSSMVDAASHNYPWLPVRQVLLDRYLSTEHIKTVTCPILMFHGGQDTIVPLSLGKKLYEAAPQKSTSGIAKTWIEFPLANHNDVVLTQAGPFREALKNFFSNAIRPVEPKT